MKAIGYMKSHSSVDFQLDEYELEKPKINSQEVLVRVKAVSVNPVDYKVRMMRNAESNKPVILGWDGAGIIEEVGQNVQEFKVGDEVYYAGELDKPGSNAQWQAVDARIVAKKPKSLSFAEAAALPLTSLTAWEALFEKCQLQPEKKAKVLIIGGAGGVGSMSIQLLRALTNCHVAATASRPQSVEWCKKMGAHVVVSYKNLESELKKADFFESDVIFCTTQSDQYLPILPTIVKPFGHICLIDEPKSFDFNAFKPKSLSLHWELMFTKSLFQFNMESQKHILERVSELVDAKKIVSTCQTHLYGFTRDNFKKAHTLLESGQMVGKIVIEY